MTNPNAFGHPSLERYDEHLCLRSVSARTRGEYGRYLRNLAAHCGRDPATLKEAEARSYLLYLKEQKRYAPSSMRIAAAALRMFYHGVLGRDWRLFDLVRSPDRQKLPLVLTRTQVRTFLGQVTQPRFRALWTLTYGCGLRIRDSLQRRLHARISTANFSGSIGFGRLVACFTRSTSTGIRNLRSISPSAGWRG